MFSCNWLSSAVQSCLYNFTSGSCMVVNGGFWICGNMLQRKENCRCKKNTNIPIPVELWREARWDNVLRVP